MPKKQTPINRVNKFFSSDDFDLEIQMGREAIEGDGNFVVILYRVNRETTQSDDIYGEAGKDDIRFLPPVELRVVPILAEAENKAYNTGAGSLRYEEDGQFTFAIYSAQLAELDVELNYGDYIGYPINETTIRYYREISKSIRYYILKR